MEIIKFGKSVKGKDLVCYTFSCKEGLPVFLILAAVHGDEIEGWWLASYFKNLWQKDFPYLNMQVILVPEVNPDGLEMKTRVNANGVDLNRNLPTKDWSSEFSEKIYFPGSYALSEPENQALVRLIEDYQPKGILTLHSFTDPQINANGDRDSGVMDFANTLFEVSAYKKITEGDGIGYSTPGCLGTYAGFERGIPTITYELPVRASQEEIVSANIPVIIEAVRFFDNKFKKY